MNTKKPNNWQTRQIGDFAKIVSGSTPKTTEPVYWGGDIGWVTPMDLSKLNGKYITHGTRNITKTGLKNCSAEIVPSNSLVMSSRAPIGYFAINKKPVATNQGCKSFVCDDSINTGFLYYALNQYLNSIKRLSGGSTFAEVGKKQLEGLKIKIPNKSIQQKIAEILSMVDKTIQKTDQIIEKTEKLKSGLMNDLLTRGIDHKKFKKTKLGEIPEKWQIVSFSDVAKITNGQVDPKIEPYKNMILIAPNHIESNSGRILEKISAHNQQAISGKYLVKSGEVIYSKIRPYLKKVAIADSDCLCSADMYPIRGIQKLTTRFLFYILLSEKFTNYANDNSGRTGIPKINRTELSNYFFALPPVEEQNKIVSILSSVDANVLIKQKIKANYISLKNGLMHEIFNQKVQIQT